MQPASHPHRASNGGPGTVAVDGVPSALLETLIAVAGAEARATAGRASPTVEFALSIGAGLRLSRARLEQLYYSALFLEAAAARASTSARANGGPASSARPEFRLQLEEGGRICAKVPFLRECREILRWVGGEGLGVRGGRSPLETRILLVAETLAELEAAGPNREPLSPKAVLERLVLARGGHLDPEVLEYLRSAEGERLLESLLRPIAGSPIAPMRELTQQAALRLRRHLLQLRPPPPSDEPAPAWFGRRRLKLGGALVAVLALLGLGTGLVSASQDAVPGDTLYPAKRAIEDVQLLLASSSGEVDLHLEFARERVQEIESLVAGGRRVPDGLLNDLSHETEVLGAHLEKLDGDEGYQLAQQLRDHGQRATNALQTLHGVNPQSEAVLAATLGELQRAEAAATRAVAEYEAGHDANGQDPAKNAPGKAGVPGQQPDAGGPPPHAGPRDDTGPPDNPGKGPGAKD